MTDEERFERGLDVYASQFEVDRAEARAKLEGLVGERFAEETIRAAACAWTDEPLSLHDRSLVVLSALIAQGGLDAQLRTHTRWALQHGSNRAELEELGTLLAIYTGFAKASTGLTIIREELAEIEAG